MTKSEYDKQYYLEHKEKILQRHRAYNVEYKKEYAKTALGKESRTVNAHNMLSKYPEKFKARELLRYAIRRGYIKRGVCEVCGDGKTEAHHEDYSKPLKVKWLCHLHHCKLEKRLKGCPLPDKPEVKE